MAFTPSGNCQDRTEVMDIQVVRKEIYTTVSRIFICCCYRKTAGLLWTKLKSESGWSTGKLLVFCLKNSTVGGHPRNSHVQATSTTSSSVSTKMKSLGWSNWNRKVSEHSSLTKLYFTISRNSLEYCRSISPIGI